MRLGVCHHGNAMRWCHFPFGPCSTIGVHGHSGSRAGQRSTPRKTGHFLARRPAELFAMRGNATPRKASGLMERTTLIAQLAGPWSENSGLPGPQSRWLGLQVMHRQRTKSGNASCSDAGKWEHLTTKNATSRASSEVVHRCTLRSKDWGKWRWKTCSQRRSLLWRKCRSSKQKPP